MAWVWYPLGIVGVLALVLGWAAAILVYQAAPRRTPNRLLALILIFEATGVGLARGLDTFSDDPSVSWGFDGVIATLEIGLSLLYIAFFAGLDSRLARRLRTPWVIVPVAVLTLAALVYHFARPELLPTTYMRAFQTWTAVGIVGFVVALTAWWEAAPGSMTRRQARAYAVAFGVRDLAWFSYVWWIFPTFGNLAATHRGWELFFAVFAPSITIVFVLLLAHAMLRTQLFDVDLRIKLGLRRSTIAAIFIAVFFAASEGAAAFVEGRTGSTVIGIGAAALLVFAMAPLQRIAERASDLAMPHVKDNDEYRTVRKREVYRAAVEGALADGDITHKERAMLAALADSLGLGAREALEVERDATAARSAASSG